jgi:hypothetical protein
MVKKGLAVLMLAAAALFLGYALSGSNAANRDSGCYWASGWLLLHHQNPYDVHALLQVERLAGYSGGRAAAMRNPPSALWMAIPLGFLPSRAAGILWSLGIVAMVMASVRILWIIHGRQPNRLHLMGYLFPPVLATILAGQTSAVMLLGICIFLWQHQARPMLAGAALAICSIKPHLFLPLAVVFLLWVAAEKAYRVLAGAVLALAAMSLAPLLLRPTLWIDYRSMMRAENLLVPTLSSLLGLAHPQWPWLRFVPALVACVWAAWYFRTRQWEWVRDGSLLLLVCLVTAPYAWFTDETVLLPAMLYAFYRASSRSLFLYMIPCGIALIEVLAGVPLLPFYIWTPLAWLSWYAANARSHQKPHTLLLTPQWQAQS